MSTRLTQRTIAKTAAYTVVYPMDAPGTIFSNMGASGGVTFTLPAPSLALLGVGYEFRGIAAQAITVTAPGATPCISKNNAACTSLAASTGGELIGAAIRAVCVKASATAYKWLVSGEAVGITYTVA